ncbi:MAG: hypothetical protein EGR49_05025 [Prevotella sp.]|nr:hypothetical protein [Prevotella sp.]
MLLLLLLPFLLLRLLLLLPCLLLLLPFSLLLLLLCLCLTFPCLLLPFSPYIIYRQSGEKSGRQGRQFGVLWVAMGKAASPSASPAGWCGRA